MNKKSIKILNIFFLLFFLLTKCAFAVNKNQDKSSLFLTIVVFLLFLILIKILYNIFKIIREEKLNDKNNTVKDNNKNTSNVKIKESNAPVFTWQEEEVSKIQFVENTKRQIENETKLNIFWPKGCNWKIQDKKNFVAYINNAYKKSPINIYMNNFGVYKVSFPSGFREDVLFNQQKAQNEEKNKIDCKNGEIDLNNLPNNCYINKHGNVAIKPNYNLLGAEWFNKNLKFINNLYKTATKTEADNYKFVINAERLPKEKDSWKVIGKIIKKQLNKNVSYYISNNGLIVKFKERV